MAINSISDAFQWAQISADSVLFTRKAIYVVALVGVTGGSLTLYSKVERTKQSLLQKKTYKTYRVPKQRHMKSPFAPKKERKAKGPPAHLVATSQRMLAKLHARQDKK